MFWYTHPTYCLQRGDLNQLSLFWLSLCSFHSLSFECSLFPSTSPAHWNSSHLQDLSQVAPLPGPCRILDSVTPKTRLATHSLTFLTLCLGKVFGPKFLLPFPKILHFLWNQLVHLFCVPLTVLRCGQQMVNIRHLNESHEWYTHFYSFASMTYFITEYFYHPVDFCWITFHLLHAFSFAHSGP